MKTQPVVQTAYLDILYANRNKAYGGYELRIHYERRVRMAIAAVLVLCTVIFLASYIRIPARANAVAPARHISTTLSHVEIERPVVIPPKPAAVPVAKPTVSYTVPKIVDDKKVNEPPKDVPKDKVPGTINAAGDPNGTVAATTTAPGTVGTTAVIDVPPPPSTPVRSAEKMPEFNGNLAEYMSRNLRYPDRARDAGIEGRVVVEFVVNEDGSISNVRMLRGIGGGCDEEALRVIHAMPNWKPGIQSGKPVKVYYTLPVKYSLE